MTRVSGPRPATEADTGAIVALLRAVDLSLYGESDASADDVRAVWGWPRFDPGRDAWVLPRAAEVAGYAWCWGPRGAAPECDGSLHVGAGARADGGFDALLEALESRARTRVAEAGLAGPARLGIPCAAMDTDKQARLAARGYRRLRTFFRMEGSLVDPPPPATSPPGVTLSRFDARDEEALHDVMQDSFAGHFRFLPESLADWRRRKLAHKEFSPEATRLAVADGRVVGASLNYRNDADGWIGMLGVRGAWRRRGLARALLLASFAALRDLGCRRACLGVDSGNADGALRLYEAAGMRVARTDHILERVLPPAAAAG